MQSAGGHHGFPFGYSPADIGDGEIDPRTGLPRPQQSASMYFVVSSLRENMEILLESYLMDYNSLETKLVYVKDLLHNAEESVMLRLDTSRNQLLVADTVIAVCTFAVSCGALVCSFYGMNLTNKDEADPIMFRIVVYSSIAGVVALIVTILYYFISAGILPSKMTRKSLQSAVRKRNYGREATKSTAVLYRSPKHH